MCMYAYMYVLYVHMIIIDKYMHNCVYIYIFIYQTYFGSPPVSPGIGWLLHLHPAPPSAK